MAEYSFMVQTMEIKPGMADRTRDEVSRDMSMSLGKLLEKVLKAIEKHPAGPGWEIISHQITRIEQHLVVTFMLKR